MAGLSLQAAEIRTNNVTFSNAPPWLKESRVEKVTQRIQGLLEWDIRRVNVTMVTDDTEFQKLHGFGGSVEAFSRTHPGVAKKKPADSIFLGPKVTNENFDAIFGHELAHVILSQKYLTAIPKWLEEGLANYVAKKGSVDYKWLAAQPAKDVTTLAHPYRGGGDFRYHYLASTAAMEMIVAKCNLHSLLQLSVGSKMEIYLKNYCEIPDVNEEFKKWVAKNAK